MAGQAQSYKSLTATARLKPALGVSVSGAFPFKFRPVSPTLAPMKGVFFAVGIVMLTGCSSFHKEWSAANKQPIPANSIQGPWAGDWHSDKNGHHGSLRCVVSKNSDSTYRAHYRATYMKILHFSYVATLNGRDTTSNTVSLEGEADLGKMAGGVYKYEGVATPTNFHSTYTSKYDHGSYDLSRPPH